MPKPIPKPQPLLAARPTLYLDYDGVLHPDEVYRRRDGSIFVKNGPGMNASLFMWAPELEQRIVHRDVQVVLATSWVKAIGFQRAMAHLPQGIASKVAGSTYHSSQRQDWDQYSRYQQIQQHATRHRIQTWLALDNDVQDWAPPAQHHLCTCDDITGISLQWATLDAWLDQYAPTVQQHIEAYPASYGMDYPS